MKKKILAIAAVTAACVCAFAFAGCGGSSTEVGFNVDDATVVVKGAGMTVEIPGNPTTGYEWTSAIEGDSLAAADENYESDAKDSNVDGAGGTYTFTYEGKSAGESVVTLTYARSWESSDDDRWVKMTVTTDGSGNITDVVAEDNNGAGGEVHN